MVKFIWAFGIFIAYSPVTSGQVLRYRNTIQVTIDYMSLKLSDDYITMYPSPNLGNKRTVAAPDKVAIRYGVAFCRQLALNRIGIGGSLGYIPLRRPRLHLVNDYYTEGHRRQRLTADLTVFYNFIRNSRHSFLLGIGPSAWYRMDNTLEELRYSIDSEGRPAINRVWRQQTNEVNAGYHLEVNYAYAVSKRISIGSRLGITSFGKDYNVKMTSLTLSTRF